MSHRAIAASVLAAAAALWGCAPTAPAGESYVSKAPAAAVLGPAVSCLQNTQIRDTRVWDDRTIDFVMVDGSRYRNTLPYACHGLGFEQRFSHKSPTNSYCSTDTITVLPTGSSLPGPTCALGEFVPVKLAP